MKKFMVLLLAMLGVFGSVVAEENEIRDLESFDRIIVSRGIEVYLTESKVSKALIISEHMPLDNIVTEVKGSTLKISLTKMIFTDVMVQIRLDYKTLQKITARNGAIVRAKKVLNLPDVELIADAGGLVEINVESDIIRVAAKKGSVIKLQGKSRQLIGKANTGSSIYAAKVECDDVEVSSGTGSNFYVYANEKINAKATSGGEVTVYGKPKKVEQSTAVGGKVTLKDLPQEQEKIEKQDSTKTDEKNV